MVKTPTRNTDALNNSAVEPTPRSLIALSAMLYPGYEASARSIPTTNWAEPMKSTVLPGCGS